MDTVNETRQKFRETQLIRSQLPPDPLPLFERWLQEAQSAALPHPTAMDLATVSAEGLVSSRLVLLRYFDERGFVFFTGLETQKAQEIGENANVALLFPWLLLERQVRVTGTAVLLPTSETLRFFASRSRESQMGAWLTQSGGVISTRSMLKAKMAEIKQKFVDGSPSLPAAWGGYRVAPRRIEFWQGHADGLHDRFAYTRQPDAAWLLERLLP
ncbi:MAG: pyridoxamine 5'-phosphate oxidase [Chloroflexota bacterium]